MKWVLNSLHYWGHNEAGAKLFKLWGSPRSGCKAVYTVGVTIKRVLGRLPCGGSHEAGVKLFTLWGPP